MDIVVSDIILDGLKEYNSKLDKNYGNVIMSYPSANPTYPYTVFDEIRNVANRNYNTPYDKVASVGYRADIYAKTKGSVSKREIARFIAKEVDNYLSKIGLLQVSYNASELENDSSIYHIILTYSGNLYENRRRII